MSEEAAADDNGGSGGEHWSNAAPEFARGWDQVKDSATPEDFYNRVGEMRTYMGNSLRIPSEDASGDDMQAFYDKLQNKVPGLMPTPDFDNPDALKAVLKQMGMPEEASGYGDVAGDEITFGDGQLDNLKAMAKDLGLTKKQFEKFAAKVGAENFQGQSASIEQNAEAVTAIQTEWGLSAEAKYQETLNFAKSAGAPEALVTALVNKQIDAPTVFWLNSLAQGTKEGSSVSFQPNNTSGNTMTPMEAQERITEMLGNMDHPYHKGDATAKKRMHEYMRQAHPERYAG